MLGASTKHVADPRSVQSLVDFSRGNLGWLQPEHTELLKRKRSSMSTDPIENGEGSSKAFNHPHDAYQRPFSAGHGSVAGIPIDPHLDTSETHSGDYYGSFDNHDSSTGGNGVGGNGQYTSNDSSSVALVERVHFPSSRSSLVIYDSNETFQGHLPLPAASRHQAAQFLGKEKVGDLVKETGTSGRPRSKRPLLPSPKDMLTGALPSRGRESPYYSHLFQPDSSLPAVHSLSGKPQSKTPRGEVQLYRRQSFAQNINPDQSLSLLPEMSSLEKDPAAFIAAAGLNMLSSGIGLQHPYESSVRPPVNQRPQVSPTRPTASTIPATTFLGGMGAYGTNFDNHSQPITVQPRMLVRGSSELGGREAVPFAHRGPPVGQPSDENYQPLEAPLKFATAAAGGKRKSIAPSSDIYTSANSIIGLGSGVIMTEPTKPMREMIVNDWVKKQKLSKTKVANLKGRGRNKKSLVVVLKISREGWAKWEEQKVEPDLVLKELVLRDGRVHRVLVDKRGSGDISAGGRSISAAVSASEYASGSATGGAESKGRGRGRPRKGPSLTPPDIDQEDGREDEGEDEGEGEDEDELEVIPQPKERRSENAWSARKREVEAKEEAANAIENEKRAKEKAILDEENARLKAIEDEKWRIEKEKQKIEDEKRRIEDEKKAAEEEKRRKENERLQAVEDEKYRRETERRRAYQEAKMMAAKMAEGRLDEDWGYDSEEEYGQQHYQEEGDGQGMVVEEQMSEGKEKCWWESELPGSSFAVAIGRRPGYHWKTQYIIDAELALRIGEPDKLITSAPTSTAKAPKAKQPIVKTRNTRKPTAPAADVLGDIALAPQSRRKSMMKATTTTKTTPSAVSGNFPDPDGEFTTSKWSLRKSQVQKTHTAGRSGPSESVRGGLRERRVISKYSDTVESFEQSGNTADWSTDIGANSGEGVEVEAVSIKGEDVEMEGYDDRWKRGGQRRMW